MTAIFTPHILDNGSSIERIFSFIENNKIQYECGYKRKTYVIMKVPEDSNEKP